MHKTVTFSTAACLVICVAWFSTTCTPVNSVYDSHFTEDGHAIPDSSKTVFKAEYPQRIGFFMETSGSMNGFLRANRTTEFKQDVWSIVSNFGNNGVYVFTDGGKNTRHISGPDFQYNMNSGAFVSPASTKVPVMMETILDDFDLDDGAVAVLVSDMKYSPAGSSSKAVLQSQYATDIRNLVGRQKDMAFSLIGAYSDYIGTNTDVPQSPYYYLLMGKDRYLPKVRNAIITILGSRFIEDVEVGFNYKTPSYDFGIVENAVRLDDCEPSFVGFDSADTCKINLELDLSDCRWSIVDKDMLKSNIKVSSCYGSKVDVGNISLDVTNQYKKQLERKAVATVELVVSDMFTDSDVIEWTLSYPDKMFTQKFMDIISVSEENDLAGSFSVNSFISGLFAAEQNHWDLTPNYILVSKKQ